MSTARYIARLFSRLSVASLRAADVAVVIFGGMPRKIDRFNRLIEPEITAALKQIQSAEVIVGIPFHKEAANLPQVVHKAQADLELRGEPAAIVIVGERKTQSLLLKIGLPPATNLVKIVRFAKPFGFGQKPGLSRRSWAHWAVFQMADRLKSDLIFIDADVRNSEGWVDLYLRAIGDGADIAVAGYIRSFGWDDAMVHVWDRLIFGALFGRWIEFRQGGDYAVSRRVVPAVVRDPLMLREGAYTLDSSVMTHVTAVGGRIQFVWLGRKEHEAVEPQRLFKRLPGLVKSVFDDIETHLPAVLAIPGGRKFPARPHAEPGDNPTMRELVGDQFNNSLYSDLTQRFSYESDLLRTTLGKSLYALWVQHPAASGVGKLQVGPRAWARATFRFLRRYLWNTPDDKDKRALAKAYVPVLEAGVLGFLNRTADMRYAEAMLLLEAEYLPAFRDAWRALARRRIFNRTRLWQRWFLRRRLGIGAPPHSLSP